jgi:hypothetical protein
LESSDGAYIFDIPIFETLLSLKSYSLTRAWSIEEYAIKNFVHMTELDAIEARDSNGESSHSFNIIEKRIEAVFCKFVSYYKTRGIVFG